MLLWIFAVACAAVAMCLVCVDAKSMTVKLAEGLDILALVNFDRSIEAPLQYDQLNIHFFFPLTCILSGETSNVY